MLPCNSSPMQFGDAVLLFIAHGGVDHKLKTVVGL